jgi:hypothetical protein
VLTSRRQHFLSEDQVKTVLAEQVESLSGRRLAILYSPQLGWRKRGCEKQTSARLF